MDTNQNVIIAHHLGQMAIVKDCRPFYMDKKFMEDYILRPVDASKMPKDLMALIECTELGTFFMLGNYECHLAASKLALLCICLQGCCCTLAGRSWQVFYPPQDGDDHHDAAGAPVRTVKIPGNKSNCTYNDKLAVWEYDWEIGRSARAEKKYSPSWSGWTPRTYGLRMCTGNRVSRCILAQKRGSMAVF